MKFSDFATMFTFYNARKVDGNVVIDFPMREVEEARIDLKNGVIRVKYRGNWYEFTPHGADIGGHKWRGELNVTAYYLGKTILLIIEE